MAMASPMPSSSSKQGRSAANVPQESTCLICSHSVSIPQEETDSEAALKWSRLIKTLCFHMQMNSKEIPKHCSTVMFPICGQCEQHAFKLYESQEKIDEEQKIITKKIAIIQRRAAAAEISRESLKPGSIPAEGKKLRDTILEGHRAKLLMKAKLQELLGLGTRKEGKILDLPTCTHTVVMYDPSIRRLFDACSSGGPSPSTSQGNNAAQNESLPNSGSISAEKDKDNEEQKDQADNPSGSTNGPAEVHDSNGQDNQVPPHTPVIPSTSMVPAARPAPGSKPSRTVAHYDEKSCTMIISKGPCGPASPPLDPLAKVKEEPRSPSPIPVRLGKRTRHSAREKENAEKVMTKPSYIPNLQCNICGRPIKGNLSNLEKHKFSHKNGQERLETIKKNQRGARNVTLRKLVVKAKRPGVNEDSKKVRKVRRGRKGNGFSGATALRKKKIEALILKEKASPVNGSFNCLHCPRSFTRKCSLVLHMQMHYRQNKAVAVTKAQNDEPPSVMDPQKTDTLVVKEKPKTCEEQPTSSAEELFSSEELDDILAETDNPSGPSGDEMQAMQE